MPKFTKSTLHKLENLLKEQDYILRYEKGNFNSGYCVVQLKKIIVVNKFYDTEGRINVLLDVLSEILLMENKLSDTSKQFYRSILKEQEAALAI
jgi:hypothetical protein